MIPLSIIKSAFPNQPRMQAEFAALVQRAEDLVDNLSGVAESLAKNGGDVKSALAQLDQKQPLNAILTEIGALPPDPGLAEQVQPGSWQIRPIDTADTRSLLTRQLADTRYLGGAHTAGSADKLATARTISATGDAIWSVTFDGSASVSAALAIAANAVAFSKLVAATQKALVGANAAGNFQEITLGSGISLTAGVLSATGSGGTVTSFAFTNGAGISGTVTNPTTTPTLALTLDANGIALSKLAAATTASILGATAAGNAAYLTPAQAKTVLAITAGDVSGLSTVATSGAFSDTTGTVGVTRGGTGLTSLALGDTLYSSAANTVSTLAGNATATKKFLTQTGTGTVSAAPAWSTIAAADVPTLNQSTTGSAATLTTGRTIGMTGDVVWTSPSFDGSGNVTAAGTIQASAVTLAKMANVATATVFYRKTAGTGAPEVQTLATLKTDLGLTGTNSGDQTITLTGDATGSGTGSFAVTVGKINGVSLAGLATGILKNTTASGAPSIAVAADFPTLNQSTTGSAATLTTPRTLSITGKATAAGGTFDGSANLAINLTAVTLAAGDIPATLNSTTVAGTGAPFAVNSTNSNGLKIAMQDAGSVVAYFGGGSALPFRVANSSGVDMFYIDSSNLATFAGHVVSGGVFKSKSYTVSTLPSVGGVGSACAAYASNGRRSGEGAGAGSGIWVWSDGSNWRTFYDNSVAAA